MDRHVQTRYWFASGLSATGTLLLHAAFLVPLVLGMGAKRRVVMPDMQGAGASALQSSAQAPTSMMLVDLSNDERNDEPPLEDLGSLGIELPKTNLIIVSTDPNPAFTPLDVDETPDSDTTQAAGDTQDHAAMFGRYIGQVSAQIERAWIRPRDRLDAPRFHCQVSIEQTRRGYVQSVELRTCNGDSRWQRSLVMAIERASPLASPPTPSVFAGTLTLDFSAPSYVAGRSDESEYEPEVRVASSASVEFAPAAATNITQDVPREGAIELRIEGKTMTWVVRQPDATDAQQRPN